MSADLTLRYTGPALDSGTMPIRDLAPALLGFADAVAAAARTLSPDDDPPAVEVRAVEHGSFTVHLTVQDPALLERAVDLLTGRETAAAVNAVAIVGAVLGAAKLTVALVGRTVSRREAAAPGRVRVTLDDGVTLDVPEDAVDLADDPAYTAAMGRAVAPVERDGVDGFTMDAPGEEPVTVDKPHVGAFAPGGPVTETVAADSVLDAVLTPIRVTFSESGRWHVSDGSGAFWVSIADQDFLARVRDSQVAFRAGDRLRVRMRVRQLERTDGALRVERIVERVLEHRPAPRGRQLTIDGD